MAYRKNNKILLSNKLALLTISLNKLSCFLEGFYTTLQLALIILFTNNVDLKNNLFEVNFIPCHVLSIMMFKCTLMKEQINFLKSKSIPRLNENVK
jgi:hypothetical protein